MTHLFFDLDGTLTDPAEGITRCLEHAMFLMGRPTPPRSELLRFIGPPLQETLSILLGTNDPTPVREAISHYRDRFSRVGLFENEPYPEIPDQLRVLVERGYPLWVVTSKPHVYARRIVDRFDLSSFFCGVHGSELDGTNVDKRDLIGHVLRTEEIDPESACMIGDRSHDIRGGSSHGMSTIGVLWGYGSKQELESAGADVLMEEPCELLRQFPQTGSGRSY